MDYLDQTNWQTKVFQELLINLKNILTQTSVSWCRVGGGQFHPWYDQDLWRGWSLLRQNRMIADQQNEVERLQAGSQRPVAQWDVAQCSAPGSHLPLATNPSRIMLMRRLFHFISFISSCTKKQNTAHLLWRFVKSWRHIRQNQFQQKLATCVIFLKTSGSSNGKWIKWNEWKRRSFSFSHNLIKAKYEISTCLSHLIGENQNAKCWVLGVAQQGVHHPAQLPPLLLAAPL